MALEGMTVVAAGETAVDVEALADALYERTHEHLLSRATTPLSTYRLQLHRGFTFRDAQALVPYLARLGVGALYASPYLQARPGSTHGYDVVDHTRLNAEVGTPGEHRALCEALRAAGLGQVLDVVPNHMGIEHGNALWRDVLENGPSSMYARFFDIDWSPVKAELKDKVLLPILGDQYGEVLERGELKLAYAGGAFRVHYYEHVLPVAPRQYAAVLGLGLEALGERLGEGHPHFVELQSILTAVRHLPARTDTERPRVLERAREKEVIKRRLGALTGESPEVAAFVTHNVELFNGRPGEARSFDRLDALLQSCSYRLAHWRVAGEEINYRRFFDINGLAALRVEDPEVFEHAHALVFRWVREGWVTGLRIDHPDGLFDPTGYFLQLQERHFLERARALQVPEAGAEAAHAPALEAALRARWRREVGERLESPLRKALYVVVEKIQGGKERIPEAWAVHGTTGYRFANALSGVFVDPAAEHALSDTYRRLPGVPLDFEELVYRNKQLILRESMASELNMLAHHLNRISEMNRRTRDFTLNTLRAALGEFIALFPVYRTYVDDMREEVDARDAEYITWTIRRAKQRRAAASAPIFDFLQDILLRRYPEHLDAGERAEMLRFAMKLQQVTGPVMAKGLEDTVFYVYHRLVSLNEVGGEPEHFGTDAHTFHVRNEERAESWPASMLTSSTHDTKRSEDVRARLNVLTELPDEWRRAVRRWQHQTAQHLQDLGEGRVAPSPNDAYLFFQTLVGAWPMGEVRSAEAWEDFRRRVREYMGKAIKEAKVHTSWTNPHPAYEEGLARFVDTCLGAPGASPFLEDVGAFKRRIERAGQHNALGQLVLKLGSPGVVDTYQGCELWDLSLVDPDNRRPVDFGLRERLLEALDAEAARERAALARRLGADMEDGRVKLYTLAEGLRLRARWPRLFREGGYRALALEGPRAAAAVALAREREGERVLVAAPRFTLSALEGEGGLAAAYAATSLLLPETYRGMELRNVFSGARVRLAGPPGEPVRLALGPLLEDFPVVILERSPAQ